jgi:formylglycine-generating enzyme required for sulfatase activity
MEKIGRLLLSLLIIMALTCSKPDKSTGPDRDYDPQEAPPGMKYVPGGSFMMGSATGSTNEEPVHSVVVSTFNMDSVEVTQADYDAVMSQAYGTSYTTPPWNASYGQGISFPAYFVNWYDAVLYCNARSKRDGMDTIYSYTSRCSNPGNDCSSLGGLVADMTKNGYRLPTEAEWEYACRAWTYGTYYWGESTSDSIINQYAWYSGNASRCNMVAQKIPNFFGLYDMSGNVEEWCHDWYNTNYYSLSPASNPEGPVSGSYKVKRGGYFSRNATYLTSSYRNYYLPNYEYYYTGFRCVQRGAFKDPPTVTAMDDIIAAPYEQVTLTATGSSQHGAITTYYWALDGFNFWDVDTTTTEQKQTTFNTTGDHLVLVKVRDVAGLYSKPDTIVVSIRNTVPANLTPANGSLIGIKNVTLRWQPGSYNHHFKVLFDPNTPPVTIVAASVTDSFYTLTTTLTYNTTYYWQIVGVNDTGDESAGNIWSFTTSGPPPILKSISGGSFQMGSTDGSANEQPVHSVTVSSFYMDSTEITQQEYNALMRVNPSRFTGDTLPVENITWYDAVLFCNARSIRDGYDTVYSYTGSPTGTPGNGCSNLLGLVIDYTKYGYRLPTEAEWEYACRAGSSTKYHFGDSDSLLGNYAWYSGNANNTTHPPARKLPNGNILYDMHGNVWEWCNDWYQADYYSSSPAPDPTGPVSGTQKVLRGGSFNYGATILRSSQRLNNNPYDKNYINGFRCVRKQ